jgi:hypothetical protein
MYDRGFEKQIQTSALAASASYVGFLYFPRAVRIAGYWAVPSVAQVAHATATLDVTFTNRGTDGLGTTVLAVITNDSDLANSATRKNSAFVAKDAVVLDTGARPDGSTTMYDAIAAGSVVEVTIAKGAGTATGDVVAGLNGFYSS